MSRCTCRPFWSHDPFGDWGPALCFLFNYAPCFFIFMSLLKSLLCWLHIWYPFFTLTLLLQPLNILKICCSSCLPCLLCFDAWCWPRGSVQDSLGSEKREALRKKKWGFLGWWKPKIWRDQSWQSGAVQRDLLQHDWCPRIIDYLAMLGRRDDRLLLPVPHSWKSWWSTPMWHCQRTAASLANSHVTSMFRFVVFLWHFLPKSICAFGGLTPK